MPELNLEYQPPPTIERLMYDNEHIFRCVLGPVGSGKSMGMIMELLRRACTQKPHNGTRYTRFALVRNTLQQLRQTVLTDVQTYLSPIVHYYVTDSTIQLRSVLPDNTKLHSDWVLIPLDTKEDVRRLLSTQLTGAWINELREVPIEVVSGILGRLGRYPSRLMGGPSWFGLLGDSNPWSTDSPYHDRFVLNPDPRWALYHQPSGIGPDAENVENLPPGYYENLAGDRDQDWVSVHVESQFGVSNAGMAVFRKSFHAPTHVRDIKPVINPHKPLMVGLDFGRTPCALITQVDTQGRLIIYQEVVTEGMGLLQMVQEHLKPALLAEPFDVTRVFVVGDPAGAQKSQITEETAFDTLRQEGFLAYPAATNSIEPRLLAVERLFRTTLMGEPAIQISRAGCPTLIQALGNRYRYRRRRDGQFEDLPEKLHPWSDLCFTLGTRVNIPGGLTSIEYLRVGDFVSTPVGPRRVAAAMHRTVEVTMGLLVTGRNLIRCTPEHRFRHSGTWVPACQLKPGDELEPCADPPLRHAADSKDTHTISQSGTHTSYATREAGLSVSTAPYGNTITAQSPLGLWSTISTETLRITTSAIWNYVARLTMRVNTLARPTRPVRYLASPRRHWNERLSGAVAKLGAPLSEPAAVICGLTDRNSFLSVSGAAPSLRRIPLVTTDDAARHPAPENFDGSQVLMTRLDDALTAASILASINMTRPKPVLESAEYLYETVTVYNIEVEEAHCYYVEGILVSNCDALQYAALGTQSNYTARVLRRERAYVHQEPVSAAGWT